MKQTNNAIKFLMAQYRAIFKNAYFKGMATALVLTAGLAAGAAQAATNGYVLQNSTWEWMELKKDQIASDSILAGAIAGNNLDDLGDTITSEQQAAIMANGSASNATIYIGNVPDGALGTGSMKSGAAAGGVGALPGGCGPLPADHRGYSAARYRNAVHPVEQPGDTVRTLPVGIEPHQYDLHVQLLHRRIAGNAVFGCGLDAVWMAGRCRRRGTADLCFAGDHPFCATLRGSGRAGRTGKRASRPGSAYSGSMEQIGFPTRRCSDPHAKK